MVKRNWGIEPRCYEPPPLPRKRVASHERLTRVLASLLIICVGVGSLLILMGVVRTSP